MEWKVVEREQEGGRERKEKRERDGGWQRKGCSVGHKLDCWSSIYGGYIEKNNLRYYQDDNKAYPKNF
jgi:hypothetical protein